MLKRENDNEKDKQLEEFSSKYNIDELFNNVINNKSDEKSKKIQK